MSGYPTREQAERIASSECDTELCHECDIMRWCTSDTMDPTSASRACGASMLAMHDEIDRLKADRDKWHAIVLRDDKAGERHQHDMTYDENYVWCTICNKDYGWFCPDSPTHVCDYHQADGSYDEDNCRYCGEPWERK